jgi:hypothetical protein
MEIGNGFAYQANLSNISAGFRVMTSWCISKAATHVEEVITGQAGSSLAIMPDRRTANRFYDIPWRITV